MSEANDFLPIPAASQETGLSTTPWQQRYWRQAERQPESAALNVAMRWQIEGSISDAAVESAVKCLVERHEILRTGFVERDGKLVQVVSSDCAVRVAHVDLQRLAADQQQAELIRIGKEEACRKLDLNRPGLIRALLVRTDPESAVLHLTMHHLIVDGWSIGILAREFGLAAAAHDARAPLVLPDIDLHFADYALWQNQMLADGAYDADFAYWMQALEGMARFGVKPDSPDLGAQDSPAMIRSIRLPRALTDQLQAQVQANGETTFSAALAGLSASLYAVTGESDIVIGTQCAGRTQIEAEQIVGPLLNTLLLRIPVESGHSFAALRQLAMEHASSALAHQGAPFELLADRFAPIAENLHPLNYCVNFNVQRAYIDANRAEDQRYGRFRLISMPSHSTGAQWPLNFFMVEREEGWRLSCEANSALFREDTVDEFLALWQQAIECAMAEPEMALKSFADSASKRGLAIDLRTAPRLMVRGKSSTKQPIVSRVARLRERIIPLQRGDRGPAIMALNIASVLFPVVRQLGSHLSFFDLRLAPSETPQSLPLRDFSDIARDAVDMIRLAQPHGPYVVFGLCVSGALAFEAAQQLIAEGEEPPLVVLNDTWRPGFREEMKMVDRQLRAWQVRIAHWRRDIEAVRAGRHSLAEALRHHPMPRALKLPEAAIALGLSPPFSDTYGAQELSWYADYLGVQQKRYRPAPYPGRVLLMRSQEVMRGRLFPHDLGWHEVAPMSLAVVECPGAHATMFRDAGAEVIAIHMRAQMQALGWDV